MMTSLLLKLLLKKTMMALRTSVGGREGRTKEKGTKEIEFGNLQFLDYTFSCRNSQENSDNEEGDSQLG